VDAGLLRSLAETGGGNFYFVEKPEAVKEVFTEELAFFVAPIAYDLDLTFEELPSYGLDTLYGTGLWKKTSTGGTVHVPSVFLVSRTSTAPGPSGGRRGGGAAILASLAAKGGSTASLHEVAKVHLKYRMPGSTIYETQDTTVTFDGVPGTAPDGGYYQDKGIEKNTLMLAFYVAFREATDKAAAGDVAGGRKVLEDFLPRIKTRLTGWTDEDLLDDLKILQQYIDVLVKAAP
jgi:Ca-activated chloride channel family protein